MPVTLQITWMVSLVCEAGLMFQLRSRRFAPLFYTYLIVDVISSLGLLAVAYTLPHSYDLFWNPVQMVIILLRLGVTMEAIYRIEPLKHVGHGTFAGVISASALVSVICGILLAPPMKWPGSLIEPIMSLTAV